MPAVPPRSLLALATATALLLGGVPALAAELPAPAAADPGAPAPEPGASAPGGRPGSAPGGVLSGGATIDGAPAAPPAAPAGAAAAAADPRAGEPSAPGSSAGRTGTAAAAPVTTLAHVEEAFRIVNEHRGQARRAPLAYNSALSRTAQRWAETMAAARAPLSNPDPWSGAPAGGTRMDQYYGKGEFTGTFAGTDAVQALTHWLLDFYPRNGTDQFARDLTHVGIGVAHVPTTGPDGPGWETYLTLYYYAYPAGQAVPGTWADPESGWQAPVPTAHPVGGAIGSRWARMGGEAVVGAPTTPERGGLAEGGVYQQFARAGRTTTIYWAPGHGAWPLENWTAIGRKWIAAGREHTHGLPVIEERSLPGGAWQMFRRGTNVYKVLWSPGAGARIVQENSAIGQRWKAAGYERGYGFPVTDEYRWGTEVRQRFSGGHTVHWSSVTKRVWVTR
ncbi:hypothetical protein AS188_01405 [Kocuria flava]|uniref:SCP domain-containing protein n=1 Tax=Kocuria flava TaxID=446860 RepID=A0A0U3HTQ4_9MICC|nr:CAP domain-containing protein [Kocuria flava]ALU38624.1 hypothetical protein AS188_01405 [Kocuria flava]GEO91667.1 hypothetical protein KFL01_09730 [Kocuria flava]